jgi:pyruvate,water dikinase
MCLRDLTGHDEWAGGKARGLSRLFRLGLDVPEGMVVSTDRGGGLPGGLDEGYRRIGGGRVAVRSSAVGEDGQEASFAGQYETLLEVEGIEKVKEAIRTCLESASSERVEAYRSHGPTPGGMTGMAVVVQAMVEPRASGVLFTADPVTGEREAVLVDAVAGLGEQLVSGRVTPDHYEVTAEGVVRACEPQGAEPLLSEGELAELAATAVRVERDLGRPVDMEWAIDGEGRIWWLQARPVTTGSAELGELDTPAEEDAVYTRSNFGEMMPGAMCPLTISTTAFGIDQGIQDMLVHCGVKKEPTRDLEAVAVFSGHIFFNLSSMLGFCAEVGGADPEQLMVAVCGQPVEELEGLPPAGTLTRAANALRYVHYAFGGGCSVRRLERRLKRFRIQPRRDPQAMYRELDSKLFMLVEAYKVHLRSSAASGAANGVLHRLVAGEGAVEASHEAAVAELLSKTGGVESADLVDDLDRVIDALAGDERSAAYLADAPVDRALAWLMSADSKEGGQQLRAFLRKHGHRALRELSMRQPGWGDDPAPLVSSIQAAIRAKARWGGVPGEKQKDGLGDTRRQGRNGVEDVRLGDDGAASRTVSGAGAEGIGGTAGVGAPMRPLVAWARSTVRKREHTKSILVDVTNRFKKGYRLLGELMSRAGLLPDPDAVFFLTHQELGRRACGLEPELYRRALHRRRAFGRQHGLEFPHVSVGRPRPIEPSPARPASSSGLVGKPVSPGVAEGRARVARTLEDAVSVQPGEILIAPVTDVGWTPYFNLIGGVATDVGSAISHGAVVAREYGLPAVVNLKSATRVFRTGDWVVLDGNKGTLERAG